MASDIGGKIFGYVFFLVVLGVVGFLIYYYGKDLFTNGPLGAVTKTLSDAKSVVSGTFSGLSTATSEIPVVGDTLGGIIGIPSVILGTNRVVPLQKVTPNQL